MHSCVHPVTFVTSIRALPCVFAQSDLSVSLRSLSPQPRKRAPPQTLPARTDSASPLAGAATENPSVPTVQTRLMQSAVSSCSVASGGRRVCVAHKENTLPGRNVFKYSHAHFTSALSS